MSYQSGFRKFHSTEGFDSGLLTGMVLIDLQKAFNTIDHNILIKKMPFLRFTDETIKWHTSHLSNRNLLSVWKMHIRIKHQ